MNHPLILASQSPRRKELLELAELQFEIHAADVDETLDLKQDLSDELKRLAVKKAKSVAKKHPGSLVLGADTTVVLDGRILGKPKHDDEARMMLKSLSGKVHEVKTSCALVSGTCETSWINTAYVEFYELDNEWIEWYLSTGEHKDKAGAYGIQGKGALLVKEIRGDFYTVMGLPIAETVRKIEEFEKELAQNEKEKAKAKC